MRKVFLFFLMPVSLNQYRGTVGMFNNIFCKQRVHYLLSLKNAIVWIWFNQTLFILLHAFPILIGFLKRIARQNMLMVYINKKLLISCFYLFLSCSCYHIWLFSRLMDPSSDIEKYSCPKKDFSQTFSIGYWNLNSFSHIPSQYFNVGSVLLQHCGSTFK